MLVGAEVTHVLEIFLNEKAVETFADEDQAENHDDEVNSSS